MQMYITSTTLNFAFTDTACSDLQQSSCAQSSFNTEITTDMGSYHSQRASAQLIDTPKSVHSNTDSHHPVSHTAADEDTEQRFEMELVSGAGPQPDAGGNTVVSFPDLLLLYTPLQKDTHWC